MELVKKLYGENVGENCSFYVISKVSRDARERRNNIISLIKNDPEIKASGMAIILNVSIRTIERDIAWLKGKWMIRRQECKMVNLDCGKVTLTTYS